MSLIIILILVALWIHALSKWFVYYASLRGLLYHIAVTFGEDKMPGDIKMKEIRDYSINRIVKDLSRKN